MKKSLLLVLLFLLSACSQMSPNSVQTTQTTPNTSNTQALIDQIVTNQNSYREAIGQEPLTNGLVCSLYTVPTTTTKIVGASLTTVGNWEYIGDFDQLDTSVTDGLNVLPFQIMTYYTQWYIVKCIGDLVITQNQFYDFSLSSDDGSNLYIDGGLLINNDGEHAITTITGNKFLEAEVHTFELDFFQATGYQALILNMDGSTLPAANFYH